MTKAPALGAARPRPVPSDGLALIAAARVLPHDRLGPRLHRQYGPWPWLASAASAVLVAPAATTAAAAAACASGSKASLSLFGVSFQVPKVLLVVACVCD